MTPWAAAHQISLSITNSWSWLKLLSWWCHQTISSSAIPFSSCLQPFPASGSFPMSQFFALGGQSIGASTSVLVLNEYSGLISFRMDLDLSSWSTHFPTSASYSHETCQHPVHVCITLGSKGNWSAFLTPRFIKVICLELFCSISFIFLVFSHWAILIPVLVIIRDLNQVYLKLETLHSWFLDMNWVTSQSMMTLDWNLRKRYLKCMEIHGECGTTGS